MSPPAASARRAKAGSTVTAFCARSAASDRSGRGVRACRGRAHRGPWRPRRGRTRHRRPSLRGRHAPDCGRDLVGTAGGAARLRSAGAGTQARCLRPHVADAAGRLSFGHRSEWRVVPAGGPRLHRGAPPRGIDGDDAPLEAIDHGLFEERIWPTLANRVAGFDALRVAGAWAGYYEYNTFDQNGIVGRIPGCLDAFIAAAFPAMGSSRRRPSAAHWPN